VSWNASQTGRDGALRLVQDKDYWWRGALRTEGQPVAVCVNPLTWRREGVAPATANTGSLPFPKPTDARTAVALPSLTPHSPAPPATTAACSKSISPAHRRRASATR